MRCEDCLYWARVDDEPLCPPDWGICMKSDSEYGRPDYPDTTAYAVDNQGDALASLFTSPAHGCVMFMLR